MKRLAVTRGGLAFSRDTAKPGECCGDSDCRALRRRGRTPLTFAFMGQPPAIGPVLIKRKRGRPRRWFRWESRA